MATRPKRSTAKLAAEAVAPADVAQEVPAEGAVAVDPVSLDLVALAPAGQSPDASLPPPSWTVIVTGPKAGRRRAGRAFGPEPVSINAMDLTEDEIAALQADPLLTVEIIDAPY